MAGREVCFSKLEVGGSRLLYLLSTWHNAGEEGLDLALSDGIQAWTGSVNEDELDKSSRKVKMDFDTFLQQTRKALTRRAVGSLNFLYETKMTAGSLQLIWKKHLPDEDIRVNLGVATLKESRDAAVVTRLIFEHAITISTDLQGKISQLESENERLSTERASALKRLEKCVAAKEDMERDLYAKFAMVVNDKKSKIRELKQEWLCELEGNITDSVPRKDTNQVVHLEENGADPSSNVAVSSPAAASKVETSDVDSEPEKRDVKEEPQSDYQTDEEEVAQPKKKARHVIRVKDEPGDDDSFLLDTTMDTVELPAASRRRRRQASAKKQTPSKPVIPKTPSRQTDSGASTSGGTTRRTPMRKSSSGTSRSSGDVEPEDLIGCL